MNADKDHRTSNPMLHHDIFEVNEGLTPYIFL